MKFRLANIHPLIILIFITLLISLIPGIIYFNLYRDLETTAEQISVSNSKDLITDISQEISSDIKYITEFVANVTASEAFRKAQRDEDIFWFQFNLDPERNPSVPYDGIVLKRIQGDVIFQVGAQSKRQMKRIVRKSGAIKSDEYIPVPKAKRFEVVGQRYLLIIDIPIHDEGRREITGYATIVKELTEEYLAGLHPLNDFRVEIFSSEKLAHIQWSSYQPLKFDDFYSNIGKVYFRANGEAEQEFIINLAESDDSPSDVYLRAVFPSSLLAEDEKRPLYSIITMMAFVALYIMAATFLMYRYFCRPLVEVSHNIRRLLIQREVKPAEMDESAPFKDRLLSNLIALVDSYKRELQAVGSRLNYLTKYKLPLLDIYQCASLEEKLRKALVFLKDYGFSGNAAIVKTQIQESREVEPILVNLEADDYFDYSRLGEHLNSIEDLQSRQRAVEMDLVQLPEDFGFRALSVLKLGRYDDFDYYLISLTNKEADTELVQTEPLEILSKGLFLGTIEYERVSRLRDEVYRLSCFSDIKQHAINGESKEEILTGFIQAIAQQFAITECAYYQYEEEKRKWERKVHYAPRDSGNLSSEVDDDTDALIEQAVRTKQISIHETTDGGYELAAPVRINQSLFGVVRASSQNPINNSNLKILAGLTEELSAALESLSNVESDRL
ncbi:MAG: hypothetical protein GF315_00650 [candidate division Zixibacteria bacterium]|nr:hypothetical protein [candidate division Zixibacteria bacterium]